MNPDFIRSNVPLAELTTLRTGGDAQYFVEVHSIVELTDALAFARMHAIPIFVLGLGSNTLFADTGFHGLIIRMCIDDSTYEQVDNDRVRVIAGAGVLFDTLIAETVTRGLSGLENLSAIPGTVGATPVQNVGAYGVEVKDFIECVSVYDTHTNAVISLSCSACEFGYRDSLFKHDHKKRYIILSVTFLLNTKQKSFILYKDLKEYFENTKAIPSCATVREAIISIRAHKFPDMRIVGTAGSFFKNPILSMPEYDALLREFPNLPGYKEKNDSIKIPLGWILDHVLHKRGFRVGDIGLFEKQALVLINYGNATTEEIVSFSQSIIDEVYERTHITIEREVNVIT